MITCKDDTYESGRLYAVQAFNWRTREVLINTEKGPVWVPMAIAHLADIMERKSV